MVDHRRIFIESLDKYRNHTKWDDGDYRGIKTVANTSVGDVGQDFIECLCDALNIQNSPPKKSDGSRQRQNPWDIEIGGVTFEVKTATEDVSGSFQFNHIRYHRQYNAVLCLGVSPNELFFNVWTKSEVSTGEAGKLVSMEKGANASYKLTKRKNQLHSIDKFEKVILEFIDRYNEDAQRRAKRH
jgi:hypothetical protein